MSATSSPVDRLTRELTAAIGHIRHGERTDALQIVRTVLEDQQPTGHTGSWLNAGARLLACPAWGEHYDPAAATRCLQATLEHDDIAGDLRHTPPPAATDGAPNVG